MVLLSRPRLRPILDNPTIRVVTPSTTTLIAPSYTHPAPTATQHPRSSECLRYNSGHILIFSIRHDIFPYDASLSGRVAHKKARYVHHPYRHARPEHKVVGQPQLHVSATRPQNSQVQSTPSAFSDRTAASPAVFARPVPRLPRYVFSIYVSTDTDSYSRLPVYDDTDSTVGETVVPGSKRMVLSPPDVERVVQRRRVIHQDIPSFSPASPSPAEPDTPPTVFARPAPRVPRYVFCLCLLANTDTSSRVPLFDLQDSDSTLGGSTVGGSTVGGSTVGGSTVGGLTVGGPTVVRGSPVLGSKRKVSSPSDVEPTTQRRRVILPEVPTHNQSLSDDDDESAYGITLSDTGYQSTPRPASTTAIPRPLPQRFPRPAQLTHAPIRTAPGTQRHQTSPPHRNTNQYIRGLGIQQHIVDLDSDSTMQDFEAEDEANEGDQGTGKGVEGQNGGDARYYEDDSDSEMEYFLAPKMQKYSEKPTQYVLGAHSSLLPF